MTTVFNEIDKVGGDPLKRIVRIELLWDKTVSSVATVAETQSMVLGELVFEGNVQGVWSQDLVANEKISPSNNVYRISYMETIGDTRNAITYYISVPEAAEDLWVGDLIVSKPIWVV